MSKIQDGKIYTALDMMGVSRGYPKQIEVKHFSGLYFFCKYSGFSLDDFSIIIIMIIYTIFNFKTLKVYMIMQKQ